MNKKGVYFFIVDVVIAILIFTVTILLLTGFFTPKQSISGIDQTLNILSTDFFTLPVSKLSTNITDQIPSEYKVNSVTVDEYIYLLELQNNDTFAKQIVKEILGYWPGNYGFKYYIDTINKTVYEVNPPLGITLNDSSVALTRSKVTVLNSLPGFNNPVLTEVTVWR